MLKIKHWRFSAILAACASLLTIGALTLPPANALVLNDPVLNQSCTRAGIPNLIVNCGFESPETTNGVVPGWTHTVPHSSYDIAPTSFSGHSGTHMLAFYSTVGDDVWTQTVAVAPHTQYLVGAWFYSTDGGAATTRDNLSLAATNVGTAPAGAGTMIYDTDNTNQDWTRGSSIITTGSARTMTIVLSGFNGPSASYIDDVFVIPQRTTGCSAIPNNLVSNCGFENASAAPWTASGTIHDSQIPSSESANTGSYSMRLASTTTDDSWSQTLSVHPHTRYTLRYWVEYSSAAKSVSNDLKVEMSNVPAASGGILVATTNHPDEFWSPVSTTFTTGSATTATLTFSGANDPDATLIDDVSVTAVPHVTLTAKHRTLTTTLTGLGGQTVVLQRLVNRKWSTIRTWTAPKTGWSKAWVTTVKTAGRYRAVANATSWYAGSTSSAITVK